MCEYKRKFYQEQKKHLAYLKSLYMANIKRNTDKKNVEMDEQKETIVIVIKKKEDNCSIAGYRMLPLKHVLLLRLHHLHLLLQDKIKFIT